MIQELNTGPKLEETEEVTMIFPVGNGPGAGRVLSVFNASCRLAVVFERVMDCRTEFRSSAQRAAAVTAIDEICLRWKTMLPDALRFNEHSDSPMNVAAIHSLYHSSAFFLLRDGLNAQTFNAEIGRASCRERVS